MNYNLSEAFKSWKKYRDDVSNNIREKGGAVPLAFEVYNRGYKDGMKRAKKKNTDVQNI